MSETVYEKVVIWFDDGLVTLGGGDEFFVESDESESSLKLDDARLSLIKEIQLGVERFEGNNV